MIDREEKRQAAVDLYLSGYNCAQAIVGAYAAELGLTVPQAARMASGFGGGMGGLRGVCGGISGMFLVLSQLRGYDDPADDEGKKRLYAREQVLAKAFTDEFEVFHCKQLLARHGIQAAPVPEKRTPEYYQKRPCAKYIAHCAALLADELNQGG